jgi:putative methionine-R-sulfoxide reductase with GAF domain
MQFYAVSTLSEAIIPVLDPGTGAVVGTLDVESGDRDAFADADRQALERVAATGTLFTSPTAPT